MLGEDGLCSLAAWPECDESKTVDETVEMAVQINGKLKATVTLPVGVDKETAFAAARADSRVERAMEGMQTVKEIFVPGKIINFVVKPL